MQRVGQALWTFIGLAIVILGLALLGLLFVLAIEAGSTFGAALLASLATVGATGLVRNFERRRVADGVRRERLGSIYKELAQVLHGQEQPPEEREKLLLDFRREALVFASPATLKAFQAWYKQFDPAPEKWRENSVRYEAFVKAMRKDLGISNWLLNEGDLARLGISDYDDAQ